MRIKWLYLISFIMLLISQAYSSEQVIFNELRKLKEDIQLTTAQKKLSSDLFQLIIPEYKTNTELLEKRINPLFHRFFGNIHRVVAPKSHYLTLPLNKNFIKYFPRRNFHKRNFKF